MSFSPPFSAKEHFPYKLYEMLEYAAVSEHSSTVSWSANGQAFAILQKDDFVEKLVPMFFKQTKLRSFVGPSVSRY